MKQPHAWFGSSNDLIVWVISLTQTMGRCDMGPSNDTLDEKRLHTHTVKKCLLLYKREDETSYGIVKTREPERVTKSIMLRP